MHYQQYIGSAAWRTNPVRLREFEAARFECRLCPAAASDGTLLEAHHRTYERFGCEADGDLTALCRNCHHHVTSFQRADRYALIVPLRADVRRLTVSVPLFDPTRMEPVR
ncbi:hypothetical protein JQ554_24240 [Bradyrhizobium diazoefficiens]|nr:hypothetical protein [Bradyrhizobium diazoefficiens]MBR0967209.1 hypothetical protein [Bradyrhizobium diazoefficiens]MBR0977375.1 hypothetical protein [Bradyrhizobium diazoefficiens]MBR1013440.1 hypothetical protein [Bradyrhizobium diazoefficiens]MBR1051697.1 hypothetical protein [Bradyrhizobium diazoefficiens]MBR1108268.1 hypothetical protein [Bradyrhizobium diazoefficiens]